MPDTIEWLTGIVEGEGCLEYLPYVNHGMKGKQYHYPSVRIVVKIADKDVVDRVSRLFKTQTVNLGNPVPPRKRLWRAAVSGKTALSLMLEMFPLLGERRKKKVNQILTKWEGNCFA